MARRFQFNLRLAFLGILMLGVSLGLIRLNMTIMHSGILAVAGLILLGASIGWPIGYMFGGTSGAIAGAGIGALLLFAGLYVLVFVLDALG